MQIGQATRQQLPRSSQSSQVSRSGILSPKENRGNNSQVYPEMEDPHHQQNMSSHYQPYGGSNQNEAEGSLGSSYGQPLRQIAGSAKQIASQMNADDMRGEIDEDSLRKREEEMRQRQLTNNIRAQHQRQLQTGKFFSLIFYLKNEL